MAQVTINKFDGPHRFLSNFFPSPFGFKNPFSEGIDEFPTVEHAYQAMKATGADDFGEVQRSVTPGEAKRWGRKIDMREDWDQIKAYVMHELVSEKFLQNRDLMNLLLKTGDAHLIEGNDWGDQYWGMCLKKGTGKNMLGKILMRVRAGERLRRQFWNFYFSY